VALAVANINALSGFAILAVFLVPLPGVGVSAIAGALIFPLPECPYSRMAARRPVQKMEFVSNLLTLKAPFVNRSALTPLRDLPRGRH
jgi:hypothetical protein